MSSTIIHWFSKLNNIWNIVYNLNVYLTLFQKSDLLNFGTGSFSWWLANGPGCKPIYDNIEPEFFRPARPTNVTGCILEYEVIEILHASIQCILSVSLFYFILFFI